MNKNVMIGLGIVVILIGGYLLMNNNVMAPADDAAMTEDAMMIEGAEGDDVMVKEDSEDAMMEGVVAIDMTGDKFRFSEDEITVNQGDTVKITLNAVDMPHDWVVDELNVRTDIAQPGETVTVEFVAETAGEYEYYCSVGQHRANGMVGTLIVK